MKANSDIYDIDKLLTEEFGEPGSETWQKAIEQAWEEYNAQVLLDARKKAKLSQEKLAKKLGVNKNYISRIERGLITPSVATFYRIAAAMNLAVELVPVATVKSHIPDS